MLISVFRQNKDNMFIQCSDVNKEEVIPYLLRLNLINLNIPDNLAKNHKGVTMAALCTTQFQQVLGNQSNAKGLKLSNIC